MELRIDYIDAPRLERFTVVATYGNWVQFLGNESAHDGDQARSFFMLVTYSLDAKQWFLNSYSNHGRSGMSACGWPCLLHLAEYAVQYPWGVMEGIAAKSAR